MLMTSTQTQPLTADEILAVAARAARAIPPLWPLSASVAVNPFLGQTNRHLAGTAARLRRVAGMAVTMPRAWYAERIASGEIDDTDLAAALAAAPESMLPRSLTAPKQAASSTSQPPRAIPTVADLAGQVSGIDWPAFISERVGHWAAGYFDQGQALWASPKGRDAYAVWRMSASHDLVPEITGLDGFAAHVAAAPETAEQALATMVEALGHVSGDALEIYFHRLLMSLGGWAQLARYRLWQAELSGEPDTTVIELLTIRLVWETALLRQYNPRIRDAWQDTIAAYAQPVEATADDWTDAILQDAAERASQRQLQSCFEKLPVNAPAERPLLQMAFCIDVRSEVFRRALESLDSRIQTLGFAGFFGLGIGHRRFASDVVEARLPVLLKPGSMTCSGAATNEAKERDDAARFSARAKRTWGRFKLAAISSFAFVEATGPVYAAKLFRDGLQLSRRPAPNDPAPRFDPAIDKDTRVAIAENVLKAMSLTEGFARLVIFAGHGANVVNNPHASALDCGACGGYSGEVNARLLAGLLNDAGVRGGLLERGIIIPQDTFFLPALHDTTTDAVTLYETDHVSAEHVADIGTAKQWLSAAAALARSERALRLPRARAAQDLPGRARDWGEVRPEWGLAGCQAFVAAPRQRTAGRSLKGRAFLHDYDWRRDKDFMVLELIMTAPVVVASWISLQYYGSVVAPDVFGAGNKLLHNVTGGIGVVEGNGGSLRVGLPWQSVHDGKDFVHHPLRLSVLIEAPREAIARILGRHPDVRALFDNRWLHLFALDERGRMAWRYEGVTSWQRVSDSSARDPANPMAFA